VPNDKNTFFNLVFTNTLTLKLGRLHKAFEIEMWVCCCEFEAIWKVELSVTCSEWLTCK
jgi:hypothetical protein